MSQIKPYDRTEEALLRSQFLDPKYDAVLTDLYTHPQDFYRGSKRLAAIFELCKSSFPVLYQEILDEIWQQNEDTLKAWILDEIDMELDNPSALSLQDDRDELLDSIPSYAYGFEWGNFDELIDRIPLMWQPTLKSLIGDFLELTEALTPQNYMNVEDFDEDGLYFYDPDGEPRTELEQEHFLILYSDRYSALNKLQSILYRSSKTLCRSLCQKSIESENPAYIHVANFMHYLFTKIGPHSFTRSFHEARRFLGHRLSWDEENLLYISKEQDFADRLYESSVLGCEILSENPILYHSLLCNYATLSKNFYSEQGTEPVVHKTISANDFIRGINIDALYEPEFCLQNIFWADIPLKNSYLSKAQKEVLSLSLHRPGIEELILSPND